MLKNKTKNLIIVEDCAICDGVAKEVVLKNYKFSETATKPAITLHDVRAFECEKCGEKYFNHEQTLELNYKLIEAQRVALSLLSANDIQAIRSSIKIAKERLEKILGFNPKSFHRWETGISIQSKAVDRILRLIRSNPELVYVLAEELHIPTSTPRGRKPAKVR